MATPERVTDSLKCLCELERGKGPQASALTKSEQLHEISRLPNHPETAQGRGLDRIGKNR